jgi:hypothetical protein
MAGYRPDRGGGEMSQPRDTAHFISARDQSDFNRPNRNYPRLAKERRSDGGRTSAIPFDNLVAEIAGQLDAEQLRGFRCLSISVSGGGMTWAAESASRTISAEASRMKVVRLAGELDSPTFPPVEQLIGWRQIARLAQRRNVLMTNHVLGWLSGGLIALGAVALSAAATILTALTKTTDTVEIGARFVVTAIALAAALLGAKVLADLIPKADLQGKTKNALADALRAAVGTKDYGDLVDDLADRISHFPSSRAIIVDDFTRLDQLTRDVIESYIQRPELDRSKEIQPELWILFSRPDYKKIAALAFRDQPTKSLGLKRTRIFEIPNLSEAERRQIALDVGRRERAHWRDVRAITRDYQELEDVGPLFDEMHAERGAGKKQRATLLQLYYILALSATTAANPWLYERELAAAFSEGTDHRTRVRTRLLQFLLPGWTLSLGTMTEQLAVVRSKLDAVVETERKGERRALRASPEAADFLIERFRAFELAEPGLVHLFWALHWYEKRQNQLHNPEWLLEISAHLLKSTFPNTVSRDKRIWTGNALTKLHQTLFNLYLDVIRKSLATCVLRDIPSLLAQAQKFVVVDAARSQRTRKRLRRLAWEAYVLLGDDRILEILLDLVEPIDMQSDGEPNGARSLEGLFLESLPNLGTVTQDTLRSLEQQFDDDATLAALIRARGAAVASALYPLVADVTPQLKHVVYEARSNLIPTFTDSLATLEAQGATERAIDYASASVGLWSLAVLTAFPGSIESQSGSIKDILAWYSGDSQRDLAACLKVAFQIGVELSDRRRAADNDGVDLVLDSIAEELLVSVLATGVVLARHSGVASSVDEEVRDLVRRCADALQVRGARTRRLDTLEDWHLLAQDVEHYLVLLQVTWRSLGFEQQAALVTVRLAQFIALVDEPDSAAAGRVLDLVSGEFGTHGHIAVLAQLVGAEGVRVSHQVRSQLLVRATAGAIELELGEHFARELCLLSVWHGHSFNLDLQSVLRHLTENNPHTTIPRVKLVLHTLPDETFAEMVLRLLNSLGDDIVDSPGKDVLAAIEERMDTVEDASAQLKARQHIAMFDLIHRPADQPIDVDAVLDRWEPWKESTQYAFTLAWVGRRASGAAEQRVASEATRVLRHKGVYMRTSGFVFLAMDMLTKKRIRPGRSLSEDEQVALEALATSIDHWEEHLSPEKNMRAFRILLAYRADDESTYRTRLSTWQQIDLEAYGVEQLPDLAASGRFFLILWHYYSVFAPQGLRAQPEVNATGLTLDETDRELANWRKAPHALPEPLEQGNSTERVLSGRFLSLGYTLFKLRENQRGSFGGNLSALTEAQDTINRSARRSMGEIYNMIRALPSLPPAIKQILTRHESLTNTAIE